MRNVGSPWVYQADADQVPSSSDAIQSYCCVFDTSSAESTSWMGNKWWLEWLARRVLSRFRDYRDGTGVFTISTDQEVIVQLLDDLERIVLSLHAMDKFFLGLFAGITKGLRASKVPALEMITEARGAPEVAIEGNDPISWLPAQGPHRWGLGTVASEATADHPNTAGYFGCMNLTEACTGR
jgi:hypothetical protein